MGLAVSSHYNVFTCMELIWDTCTFLSLASFWPLRTYFDIEKKLVASKFLYFMCLIKRHIFKRSTKVLIKHNNCCCRSPEQYTPFIVSLFCFHMLSFFFFFFAIVDILLDFLGL